MNELPTFPDFIPLNLGHRDTLMALAQQFPPYSDFNFVSMFTWDVDNSISISGLNGNIVVKFSDYNDASQFFSLLGVNELTDTLDYIFEYSRQQGLKPELKLIGEAIIDALPESSRSRFIISEDRDNHDYILSAPNMADLSKIHPKKRTKYNHFVREYENRFECRELDLDSEATHQDIKQLLIDWQNARDKDSDEIQREFAAINRCLSHHSDLNIQAFGTYLDGQLIAFTMFEILHNKTAMLHFGKSNTLHKGSNEHLQHNLAKFLESLDVEFMNNEQDMGIEGLRKSKEASLPVDFLKKYTIAPAD